MREPANAVEDLSERLTQVEAQIAKKQGKADQRSAAMKALLRERDSLQARLEAQKKDLKETGKSP